MALAKTINHTGQAPPPMQVQRLGAPQRFRIMRHGGYDTTEVDKRLSHLETENERLTRVNEELYRMWLKELNGREYGTPFDVLTDQEIMAERDKWQRLYVLLHESTKSIEKRKAALEAPPPPPTPPPPSKRSRVRSILSGMVFYLTVFALMVGVFLFFGTNDNPAAPPQNIAGFSAMTVLTRSMQSTIPQHSLIVTRQVDPSTIQVGDDITFLVRGNMTITHRVIEVLPNYYRNEWGFRTQGTDNAHPDAEVVLGSNIVGLVIFSNLTAGNAILFIRSNLLLVGIGIAVTMAVFFVLRFILFKKAEPESGVNVPH